MQEHETGEFARRDGIWLRGLWMLVLALLFAVAETVLWVCTILQFGWMLFTKERNGQIAAFGEKLGNWLAITARFQSGASEEKPFPWTEWR